MTVAEDPDLRSVLAQMQLQELHVVRPLPECNVPDGRRHCFTVDNMGASLPTAFA